MSEGIIGEVFGTVPPELLGALRELSGQLKSIGATTEEVGRKVDAGTNSWQHFQMGVSALLGNLSAAWSTFNAVADSITRLSAEHESLIRNSSRLGVNFDEAAASAGRFVDETETMGVATRFAEAGLRLTQEQLDQLSRRAAIFAQNTGVETSEAFDRMFAAIESGSERALRPFGPTMLALAGDAHTAQERLDGFVTSTRTMATATDDARSAWLRFKDSIDDVQRTMAGTFFEAFAEAEERVRHLEERARAAGRTTREAADQSDISWRDVTAAAGVAAAGAEHLGLAMGHMAIATAHTATALTEVVGPYGDMTGASDAADRSMENVHREAQALIAVFGIMPAAIGHLHAPLREAAAEFDHVGASVNALERDLNQMAAALNKTTHAPTESAQKATEAESRAARARRHGGGAATSRTPRTMADLDHPDIDAMLARSHAAPTEDSTAFLMAQATNGQTIEDTFAPANDNAGKRTAQTTLDAFAKEQERARSFSGAMRDAFNSVRTPAQNMADTVVGAFNSMGEALATHIEAWASGRESLGEAFQGIAHDFLASLSKQAIAKAAMEFGEALASLALGPIGGVSAVGHFAAAAAFTAVGALAGAGAAATAPSAASSAGGARTAANASPTPATSAQQGGGTIVQNLYFGAALATQADIGRAVIDAAHAANRQLGIGFNGRVAPGQRAA